jgi:hypothetical protein
MKIEIKQDKTNTGEWTTIARVGVDLVPRRAEKLFYKGTCYHVLDVTWHLSDAGVLPAEVFVLPQITPTTPPAS